MNRIAVAGAAGRMGRRVVALAAADPAFECVAALEHAGHAALGKDAGALAGVGKSGVLLSDRAGALFDVLIDFSLPDGTMTWLDACLDRRRAMVTGVTGLTEAHLARLRAAAEAIPILRAPNMSVGVNVLLRLAEMLGRTLDVAYDVEITETHHRAKRDAPSGTAIALSDAVSTGRTAAGGSKPAVACGRRGETGARPPGEIGVHSLRMGDVVGEHAVSFATEGETITLVHSARSRDVFARGALRAAAWIVGREPGLYGMADVLFSGRTDL